MSALERVEQQTQAIVQQIRSEQFRRELEAALPATVSVEKFGRVAITALREQPDLVMSDQRALFGAVMRCAQDGLLPDGHEAALVLFGGKASYLPMIGGLRKIAAEHGWQLLTRVVYAADDFEYEEGLEPKLVHKPARPGVERGEIVAAYAIGRKRGEEPLFEVMHRPDIEKVRKVSRAANRGPWVDWFERMCEKTAGKRLFAKLPLGDLDERVKRVLAASEMNGEDAAALMYGQRPALTSVSGGGSPPDEAAVVDGAGTPAAGQQVEEAASASAGAMAQGGADAAASSAPDAVADADVPIDGEPFAGPSIEEQVAVAIKTEIPSKANAGKTLGDILLVEGGEAWFARTLRAQWPPPEFRVQLELVARERLPEVWTKYETERAA